MDDLFLFLFLVAFVCLMVGLIRPTAFARLIPNGGRRQVGMVFGVAMLVSFVLFGATTDTSQTTDTTQRLSVQGDTENAAPADRTEAPSVPPTSPPTSPPTMVPTARPTAVPTPVAPALTTSQKNAVRKAKDYLRYTAFSRDGLVDQLEFEGFSNADASYGADNAGADWFEQAAKKAADYMEYSAFSREGLIDQLMYEKFTRPQAEHGADSVGL